MRLFFLPDVILYWQDGRYGAITYHEFQVEQGFTRFIEEQDVPADSVILDRTWRYVNKNGGPDRRFNNNRQIPVLQYGVLIFASLKGLNIHLNTSNAQQSLAFANCWRAVRERPSRPQERQAHQEPRQQRVEPPSSPKAQARKLLGVSEGASDAEISAAYHRLAKLYHPDKVAGLAIEFQILADKRMKEINAAYELLKRRI
jgi:hypothetical protein